MHVDTYRHILSTYTSYTTCWCASSRNHGAHKVGLHCWHLLTAARPVAPHCAVAPSIAASWGHWISDQCLQNWHCLVQKWRNTTPAWDGIYWCSKCSINLMCFIDKAFWFSIRSSCISSASSSCSWQVQEQLRFQFRKAKSWKSASVALKWCWELALRSTRPPHHPHPWAFSSEASWPCTQARPLSQNRRMCWWNPAPKKKMHKGKTTPCR